ncbi:MAG: galactokinase [Treponema sp.]|jgi:galactokinase|nr:galactokinase [Treponema sp.]
MKRNGLLDFFNSPKGGELLESLYGPPGPAQARKRYAALVEGLLGMAARPVRDAQGRAVPGLPGEREDLWLFSAPGRTELGGNHTDHNRGKALAAAAHLDIAAALAPRGDHLAVLRSAGYPDTLVDLTDTAPRREERGTTAALIRGTAAGFAGRGIRVRGFSANAGSTIPAGAGLASSAALETLIGQIFNTFSGGPRLSPLEIARIGQRAEQEYFGKPSGLMDQTVCALGGALGIDFADPQEIACTPLRADFLFPGYALCVADTRSGHADLTDEYAAIPAEMAAAARFFGKTALRELTLEDLMAQAPELRKRLGDRPLLRAIHFFNENKRVDAMREALEKTSAALDPAEQQRAWEGYLALVNESGDSSCRLLQNSYALGRPQEQGIPLALELSRKLLAPAGAWRVHGGGFGGTIQAYIPPGALDAYRQGMEAVFGAGAVTPLHIRPSGSQAVAPQP